MKKPVTFHWSTICAFVSWYTAHVIELHIWFHIGEVCKPIGHGEESSNGGDVPGIFTVKAVFLQSLEMLLRDAVASTYCHRKVQHGMLSR